ncbi:MAG: hypothetical protein AAF721_09000 [Myxococcota bacterium]
MPQPLRVVGVGVCALAALALFANNPAAAAPQPALAPGFSGPPAAAPGLPHNLDLPPDALGLKYLSLSPAALAPGIHGSSGPLESRTAPVGIRLDHNRPSIVPLHLPRGANIRTVTCWANNTGNDDEALRATLVRWRLGSSAAPTRTTLLRQTVRRGTTASPTRAANIRIHPQDFAYDLEITAHRRMRVLGCRVGYLL